MTSASHRIAAVVASPVPLPDDVVTCGRRALADLADAVVQREMSGRGVSAPEDRAVLAGGQAGGPAGAPIRAAFVEAARATRGASVTSSVAGQWPVVAAVVAAKDLADDADDRTVAEAAALGLEVAVRLVEPLAPVIKERGLDADAMCGRIGAAVAVARLLRLSAPAAAHAIGIAATQAAGLVTQDPTVGGWQAGKAAADGLEAGLLAAAGYTAAEYSLDGPRGVLAINGADPASDVAAGFGERWRLPGLLGDIGAHARSGDEQE